ncbi:thioredoxin domain-containing protein [candidate division KSB1 bacterium]|nr:thioredoxin domain-containing protein [candidate division KSB1 bacterium]
MSKRPFLNKGSLWGVVIVCILGGWLAILATDKTLKVARYGLANPGGCSVNDWLSCDAVHATSYAVMLGIPVAWWGVLFYMWTFLAVGFSLLTKNRERASATLAAALFLSVGAVLFSFYKSYHLLKLQVLCILCVGMYLVNFVIPLLLAEALGLSFKKFAAFIIHYIKNVFGVTSRLEFSPQPVLYGALVTSLFSLGYIGIANYEQNRHAEKQQIERALQAYFEQDPVAIKIGSSAPVWGNPQAKITIVEYSDFECRACQVAAFHLRGVLFEYRNDVRLYYLNYPLDGSINDYVKPGIHENAGLAARASVCAQQQGVFWAYHDDLFRNQKKLNREFFLKLAEKQGCDVTSFAACMDAQTTIQKVRRDIDSAHAAKVQRTPSVFINGRSLPYWYNTKFLRRVIHEELKRLRK